MSDTYYMNLTIEEMPFAMNLGITLIDIYEPKSVIDIGCATGLYLLPFMLRGRVISGIEISDKAIRNAVIPQEHIFQKDITKPLGVDNKCDMAICLEVLEHIEESMALAALTNIVPLSDRFIFSAAIPGQGGEGHINCQQKFYWQSQFEQRGFARSIQEEYVLKERLYTSQYMGWFMNNFMMFVRN